MAEEIWRETRSRMVVELSAGAARQIFDGQMSSNEEPFKPVMQVSGVKEMSGSRYK